MKGRTGLAGAGLVFILAAGILVLFRDVVREEVLNPILYLFWLGWLALRSIDQPILWGGLWLVLLGLGLRSLIPDRKPSSTGLDISRRGSDPGRARFWATQMVLAGRSDFFYQDARQALKRLAYAALAGREGVPPDEIELRIQRGEIQIPLDIQELLFNDRRAGRLASQGVLDWLHNTIQFFGRRSRAMWDKPGLGNIDPRWERMVRFIEEQLEREEHHENE